MKKENPVPSLYDEAITRVKLLFSRDQNKFPETIKNPQVRAYDYVKIPDLLPSQNTFVLHNKDYLKKRSKESENSLSKKQVSFTGHSNCSLSPRYLMHLLMEMKTIEMKKVKNLHLKEYLIAQRNFRKMGETMNEWMNTYLKDKIKVIPKETPKVKDEIPWEDFVQQKEERQFLITRVIKYLLD